MADPRGYLQGLLNKAISTPAADIVDFQALRDLLDASIDHQTQSTQDQCGDVPFQTQIINVQKADGCIVLNPIAEKSESSGASHSSSTAEHAGGSYGIRQDLIESLDGNAKVLLTVELPEEGICESFDQAKIQVSKVDETGEVTGPAKKVSTKLKSSAPFGPPCFGPDQKRGVPASRKGREHSPRSIPRDKSKSKSRKSKGSSKTKDSSENAGIKDIQTSEYDSESEMSVILDLPKDLVLQSHKTEINFEINASPVVESKQDIDIPEDELPRSLSESKRFSPDRESKHSTDSIKMDKKTISTSSSKRTSPEKESKNRTDSKKSGKQANSSSSFKRTSPVKESKPGINISKINSPKKSADDPIGKQIENVKKCDEEIGESTPLNVILEVPKKILCESKKTEIAFEVNASVIKDDKLGSDGTAMDEAKVDKKEGEEAKKSETEYIEKISDDTATGESKDDKKGSEESDETTTSETATTKAGRKSKKPSLKSKSKSKKDGEDASSEVTTNESTPLNVTLEVPTKIFCDSNLSEFTFQVNDKNLKEAESKSKKPRKKSENKSKENGSDGLSGVTTSVESSPNSKDWAKRKFSGSKSRIGKESLSKTGSETDSPSKTGENHKSRSRTKNRRPNSARSSRIVDDSLKKRLMDRMNKRRSFGKDYRLSVDDLRRSVLERNRKHLEASNLRRIKKYKKSRHEPGAHGIISICPLGDKSCGIDCECNALKNTNICKCDPAICLLEKPGYRPRVCYCHKSYAKGSDGLTYHTKCNCFADQ